MKAKTIFAIEGILKQKKDNAYSEYRGYKNELEKKYNTEWIGSVVTSEESRKLKVLDNERLYMFEVYEDFKIHQW